jgi:acyl-CoA dehydrogenase
MDLTPTPRSEELRRALLDFMDECVYPAEPVYARQRAEADDPHAPPPVLEELKSEARSRGLWNLFLSDEESGAGLSNLEYAPLAEITGRSQDIAPEALNCSAPDTGNMELLAQFGTPEQKERWLTPLLEGEIRSCFSMTEPAVASSDPSNLATTIGREGEHYLVNGRKWWSTGALDPRCRVAIVMGATDPDAAPHSRHGMILVPLDTPGVTIARDLTTFGYTDRQGHGEIEFDQARVPAGNLIGEPGSGFAIAQARLGPGRIHHCMRVIGAAERSLDLMVRRAVSRRAFGKHLSDQGVVATWIAESRIELEQARLLTLKAAWMMDTVGNRHARSEIAAIKVVAARVATHITDRAIQVFGGAGLTEDTPLALNYARGRQLRFADGPDEVHLRSVAREEIRRVEAASEGEVSDPSSLALASR